MHGLELRALPDAAECCGFGGTFAVKNADVSSAMLADKLAHVEATRGRRGLRLRQLVPDAHRRRARAARLPVRALHLAEILAMSRGRARRSAIPFPEAAPAALANAQLRANIRHATTTIRAKRARGRGRAARLGGAPRGGPRRSRTGRSRTSTSCCCELEAAVDRGRRDGALGARRATRRTGSSSTSSRATGAGEVVKVKSLTTDEIRLNEALAAAGSSAIETDLAELIVQLAGERPSHLLVPAIHKNRTEIRDLFRERLGASRAVGRSRTSSPRPRAAPALGVPARARRDLGAQLRGRRDRARAASSSRRATGACA